MVPVVPVVRQRNDTNEVHHPVSLATKLYQEQIHGMYWHTRKKEMEKEKTGRMKRKENKRKKAKQTSAEGAGRVPRGQDWCLLVRSVLYMYGWVGWWLGVGWGVGFGSCGVDEINLLLSRVINGVN